MTDSALARHIRWRDSLVHHLRMDNVPGDRIGDILLEVESHITETGETPQEAFGDPKAYASSRITPADRSPDSDTNLWLIIVLSFFGSMLYVSGALGAGRESASVYGVNPWLLLAIGVTLLVFTARRIPDDLVRHPTTGNPMLGNLPHAGKAMAGFIGVLGIVFFFLGRMLA